MEWVGIGILIAIGIYLAPLIITMVLGVFVIVVAVVVAVVGRIVTLVGRIVTLFSK